MSEIFLVKRNKLPSAKTINIQCKDISEHWAIIWDNLLKFLENHEKKYLTTIPWNFVDLQFQMKYHSSYISCFNINLLPNYYDKQLHVRYNNPTLPNIHSQVTLEGYSTNQYLKSILIKSAMQNEEKRRNIIPNYYIYNYGIITIDDKQFEDIVYTVQIPCMIHFEREQYPIISVTFSMLIPLEMNISNNIFLWDIFLDNLNLIFFQFQLKHFEDKGKNEKNYKMLCDQLLKLINNFDDYLLSITSKQSKKEMILPDPFPSEEFISKIITSHIMSYYTILLFDEYKNSQYIYDICYILDSQSIYNQPFSSTRNPKLLHQINPFMRTMCLTSLENDNYYSLPYPYTIINCSNQSIVRNPSQSSIIYFTQRANYFLGKASKILSIDDFIPTITVPNDLVVVSYIPIEFHFIELIKNFDSEKSRDIIERLLFKYCDLLAMKAHVLLTILNDKTYLKGQMTFQTVSEFKKVTGYSVDQLKLVLSILKFSESYLVGIIIETLERYEQYASIV